METKTVHTATPYLTNGREIFTSDGQVIARMEEIVMGTPFAGSKNAAFIVRACNAHDDLVKALRDLYNAIDSCVDLTPQVLANVLAALAKAEGKEE